MKKKIFVIVGILVVVLCLVCIYFNRGNEKQEEKTLLERINTAKTFEEITSCNNWLNKDWPETDEEKQALSNKSKEYILDGYKINGIYYYNKYYASGTMGYRDYGYHIEEKIAVYMNNENEIYIIPISDNQLINNDNLDQIPNMDNSNKYKYSIDKWNAYDSTWQAGYNCISLELTDLNYNFSLNIKYAENNGFIEIYGQTPGQKDKSEYNKDNIPYGGKYYKSEDESLKYAQSEYEGLSQKLEDEQNKNEELANSIPKVGMSASEVRKTKWGSPDKINKDTYAWGTTEQWVYDDYGYVYLENGIVTTVSER